MKRLWSKYFFREFKQNNNKTNSIVMENILTNDSFLCSLKNVWNIYGYIKNENSPITSGIQCTICAQLSIAHRTPTKTRKKRQRQKRPSSPTRNTSSISRISTLNNSPCGTTPSQSFDAFHHSPNTTSFRIAHSFRPFHHLKINNHINTHTIYIISNASSINDSLYFHIKTIIDDIIRL